MNIDHLTGALVFAKIAFEGLLIAAGIFVLILLIKRAKKFRETRNNVVNIQGIVQSVCTRDIPITAGSKIMSVENFATVKFRAEDLLRNGIPADIDTVEVNTALTLFKEGDSLNCAYRKDSRTFVSNAKSSPLNEPTLLAVGFVATIFVFILFPVMGILQTLGIVKTLLTGVLAFMGFGAVALTGGILQLISYRLLNKGNVVAVEGKISAYETNVRTGDVGFHFPYSYTFSYNGKNYSSPKGAGDMRREPVIGEPVTVYFNEDTEEFSEKHNAGSTLSAGIVFTLIGIALFALAIRFMIG